MLGSTIYDRIPNLVSEIEIQGLQKKFGAVQAVRECSLHIPHGEFVVILGPSGCGKTTLLRLIGGFLAPDSGSIIIGGHDVARLPPFRRNIGFVFQSYALFPHLTVEQNLAFGLKMRGRYKTNGRERIRHFLEMVRLSDMEARMPHQLSGGQQQRVALARALVTDPDLLLLDEPLGALDRKLREAMQIELKELQRTVGITTLLVTHDQEEAITTADRIVIMNEGKVEQIGAPAEIYDTPRTRFVANFIGNSNFFSGSLSHGPNCYLTLDTGGGITFDVKLEPPPVDLVNRTLMVRPENVRVRGDESPGNQPNLFPATVKDVVYQGSSTRVYAALGALSVSAVITNYDGSGRLEPMTPGQSIFLSIDPTNFRLLDR